MGILEAIFDWSDFMNLAVNIIMNPLQFYSSQKTKKLFYVFEIKKWIYLLKYIFLYLQSILTCASLSFNDYVWYFPYFFSTFHLNYYHFFSLIWGCCK